MTGAVQGCPAPPPSETRCEQLAREIDEMINRDKHQCGGGGTHGLKHRFREQVAPGAQGPGTPSWERHDGAIRDQQRGLRDRLDEYERRGCGGGGPPLPEGARRWGSAPRPTPSQWRHNNPEPAPAQPDPDFMKRMSELTGLTGAALILYLIISEGSRLFPPRNLVPIP